MEKKLSASSRGVKPIKKSSKNITTLSAAKRNELNALKQMSDEHIDYSDIPELDFNKLGKPVIGKFYRPVKKAISIRLDADVLDWFKSKSDKYQKLINHACRLYYLHHSKKAKRK